MTSRAGGRLLDELVRAPARHAEGYAGAHEHRPLAGYLALTGAFWAAFLGSLGAARARGHELPERIDVVDVVLLGVATQRVSRTLSKDRVTSALRAPFTEYQGRAGHGEVEERARGRGLRLAIGELLVCPYCLAQWVAGGFAIGMVVSPRLTRLLAAMWTIESLGDAAQLAVGKARNRS